MRPRGLLLGLMLGITATLFWGGQAVVARTGILLGYSAFDLAVLRYMAASLVLAPFAFAHRRVLASIGLPKLLTLATLGGFGNAMLFSLGLVFAPASHAGAVAPISAALSGAALGIVLLGEWPTRGRIAALCVIVAGVLLIGWDGITGAYPGAWRGDLILICAGSIWGAFAILLRRWRVPALAGNAATCVLSALVIVPPWLLLTGGEVLVRMSWTDSLVQGFAQGVLSSALATTLYARAAELIGATRAACLSAMVPVTTLILSSLILGEPLAPAKLGGVALAVGGMLAAVLFTGRRVPG